MSKFPTLKESEGDYDYILHIPPRFNDKGEVSMNSYELKRLYYKLKEELDLLD